jgi:hypothetical protein
MNNLKTQLLKMLIAPSCLTEEVEINSKFHLGAGADS